MMKPRALIPFLTICSNAPTLEETVDDLQSELRRTQAKLTEESRKRAEAEAYVAILKANRVKQPVVPRGDCEEGYECSNCGRTITDDFTYCPDCGHEIDWDGWSLPEPNEDDHYHARRSEPLNPRFVHYRAAKYGGGA